MPRANSRIQFNAKAGARGRSSGFLAPAALVAIACIALAIVTRPASSQLDSSQTQSRNATVPLAAPQPDPPGTIDGAKNPELIPDETAYRLVLLAFAEPENPTDAQTARFQAKIAGAGLSDDDTEAFRRISAHMQTELDDLRAQESAVFAASPMPHPDSVGATKLVEISHQRDAVFAEAMSALPARLSASGAAMLHDFVQREKRGMKYNSNIPMGPR